MSSAPLFLRPLFSHDTSTWTYILACEKTKECVIIDPVIEEVERDTKFVNELGFKPKYIAETHVHADHITGGKKLREKFPEAIQVYGANSGVTFTDGLKLVKEGDVLQFGNQELHVLETPGHTSGCLSYYTGDKQYVFTGDALFVRGCGRTDFQQGDSGKLYDSVMKLYKTLPDACAVMPGHDYKGMLYTTIGEEKRLNPRIFDGQTREAFQNIMQNLNLPHPRYIDKALPANLKGGVPGEA